MKMNDMAAAGPAVAAGGRRIGEVVLDLQNISNALKPLVRSPQVDAARALHTTLAWLAFFKLWELAAGKTLSTPVMAMAALGIVGAKLFIVGASISATNALALGLALVCLPWRQHAMAVPVLSIAMFISLAASGLAPYEPLGQAQAWACPNFCVNGSDFN